VSTAEYGPVSTAEYGPVSTAEYSPVSTAEYGPVSTAEYGPVSTAEYSPVSTAEYGPVSTAEYGPVSTAEYGPVSTAEYGPVSAKGSAWHCSVGALRSLWQAVARATVRWSEPREALQRRAAPPVARCILLLHVACCNVVRFCHLANDGVVELGVLQRLLAVELYATCYSCHVSVTVATVLHRTRRHPTIHRSATVSLSHSESEQRTRKARQGLR
jgi:hypothetical protein